MVKLLNIILDIKFEFKHKKYYLYALPFWNISKYYIRV